MATDSKSIGRAAAGLDEAQEAVAAHGDGHALILAGAGSGKTECAKERIARRIEGGVPSRQLIAVSFTTKASKEMGARLADRLGDKRKVPWVGTLHALGFRLVHERPECVNRKPGVTLLSSDEAEARLKAAIAAKAPCAASDIPKVIQAVHHARNAGHDEGDISKAFGDVPDSLREFLSKVDMEAIESGFSDYARWKREHNLVDYDDHINLPLRALESSPEARAAWTRRFRDVTVDEAQDLALGQYRLLRALDPQTLVLIGDDDQSIYRWRGARPEVLATFLKEFGASQYKLERNYRSRPSIVNAAKHLVSHNSDRLSKDIRAVRDEDRLAVRYRKSADVTTMADTIAASVRSDLDQGVPPAEIAVLYRVNRLAQSLEAAFMSAGVPYRLKKGNELLQRTEVRLLLAVARAACNPSDSPANERINALGRDVGLKPEDVQKALQPLRAAQPKLLLPWALKGPGAPLFKTWLEHTSADQAKKMAPEGSDQSLIEANAEDLLVERIGRLVSVQSALDERLTQGGAAAAWSTVTGYIIETLDDELDDQQPAVVLSTIHGAKGLQWRKVHVAGFSEGLMPFSRSTPGELTEERCLAYVALTRARDSVVLHHPERFEPGGQALMPSRFLEELRTTPGWRLIMDQDLAHARNDAHPRGPH